MNGLQQAQRIVLLSRQIELCERFVFNRFQPVVGSPQTEVRFLLEGIKTSLTSGRLHAILSFVLMALWGGEGSFTFRLAGASGAARRCVFLFRGPGPPNPLPKRISGAPPHEPPEPTSYTRFA